MIPSKTIKILRSKTQAGFMNCKNALEKAKNDMDLAIKILKEEGKIKSASRSMRNMQEGLLNIHSNETMAVFVELNCETDFVSRTSEFKNGLKRISDMIFSSSNMQQIHESQGIQEIIEGLSSKVGEGIKLGRVQKLTIPEPGSFLSYMHPGSQLASGVIITAMSKSTYKNTEFQTLLEDIAMHIVALRPEFLCLEDIPKERINENKEILRKRLDSSSTPKPTYVQEKILDGQLKQIMNEIVLTHQAFVKNPKVTIMQHIESIAKSLQDSLTLKQFTCFQIKG